MEVRAQLHGLRLAPRKVRLVVGLIKEKNVATALDQIGMLSNRAGRPVVKLIESAVANAENNFRMVRSNLYIKSAWVDQGIKLKRWMPRGFGRAGEIQKHTSHLNIVLDERVAGMRSQASVAKAPAAHDHDHPEAKESGPEKARAQAARPEATDKPASKGIRGLGRRLFQRKTI